MNKRVQKLWMDALRSGEYKQGKSRLLTVQPDGTCEYCCLGVLTDLYIKEHPGEEWKIVDGDEFQIGEFDSEEGLLPECVMSWAELPTEDPFFEEEGGDAASSLNDDGFTFPKLADLIEVNL